MKFLGDPYLILLPTCAGFGPLMMVPFGGSSSQLHIVGACLTALGVLLLTFKIKSLQQQIEELKNNK